jgi:hypothetical protein
MYRVVEDDPYDGPMTWAVASRRIVTVRRDGRVTLESPMPGSMAKHIVPGGLLQGSREAAIGAFIAEQEYALDSAQRRIAKAQRALLWAQSSSECSCDLKATDGNHVRSCAKRGTVNQ